MRISVAAFFPAMPSASPTSLVSGPALGDATRLHGGGCAMKCFSNALTAPGQCHTVFSFACVVLLTATLQAAMSSSSTLKRRASRSTIGCRKEERACSPPPAFPGLHCWERAERAGKAMRLKQIIFVSVSAGDTWINMLLKLLVLTRCY